MNKEIEKKLQQRWMIISTVTCLLLGVFFGELAFNVMEPTPPAPPNITTTTSTTTSTTTTTTKTTTTTEKITTTRELRTRKPTYPTTPRTFSTRKPSIATAENPQLVSFDLTAPGIKNFQDFPPTGSIDFRVGTMLYYQFTPSDRRSNLKMSVMAKASKTSRVFFSLEFVMSHESDDFHDEILYERGTEYKIALPPFERDQIYELELYRTAGSFVVVVDGIRQGAVALSFLDPDSVASVVDTEIVDVRLSDGFQPPIYPAINLCMEQRNHPKHVKKVVEFGMQDSYEWRREFIFDWHDKGVELHNDWEIQVFGRTREAPVTIYQKDEFHQKFDFDGLHESMFRSLETDDPQWLFQDDGTLRALPAGSEFSVGFQYSHDQLSVTVTVNNRMTTWVEDASVVDKIAGCNRIIVSGNLIVTRITVSMLQ